MILVSPPYRTKFWGCLLADSGTDPRKLLDQLRDALVCSYYVRCVRPPRDFWRTNVFRGKIIVRTASGLKLLDKHAGTSQSSKLLRVPFAGLDSLSPAAATGLRSSPAPKGMTSNLAPRVLCSRAVSVGNCRLTALWGNPGDARAEADVAPPRPFRRSARHATPCWLASATAPPAIAVRSPTRPQR